MNTMTSIANLHRIALAFALDAIYLHTADSVNSGRPKIFYANHVSYLDGHVLFQVSRAIAADFNLVVATETNNRMLKLIFRKQLRIVNPSKPAEAMLVLRSARQQLLDGRLKTLWIFPQGRFRRRTDDITDMRPGILTLMHKDIDIIPVAIQYELTRHTRPYVFVSVGNALSGPKSLQELSERHKELYDNLERGVHEGSLDMRSLLRTSKRYFIAGWPINPLEFERELKNINVIKDVKVLVTQVDQDYRLQLIVGLTSGISLETAQEAITEAVESVLDSGYWEGVKPRIDVVLKKTA